MRIFTAPVPFEAPARRAGMSLRNFRAPLQTGDGRQPAGLFAKVADRSRQAPAREQSQYDAEISDAVVYQPWPFSPVLFQRYTGVSPSAYRERFGV